MGFKFLNINPFRIREEDCVARAIALATEQEYFTIWKDLNKSASMLKCEVLCVCCYKHLLDEVYGLERIKTPKKTKIKDFARKRNKGTYLIRIKEHLTTLIDGNIYDIWNCENEYIDIVWKAHKIEEEDKQF